MLNVIIASCASDPLVACNVSCESPAGVLEEAVTVNVCDEFAPTVIGDAGMVDVPAGRPDIATEADPLNPFDPTIETVTGTLVLPCIRLTEVDENRDVTDTEKSGTAAGGGVVEIPPPQPIIRDINEDEMRNVNPRRFISTGTSTKEGLFSGKLAWIFPLCVEAVKTHMNGLNRPTATRLP